MFGNDMTQDDLRRLYDATIVDENGDKVGGVGQIYLDDQTDRPTWATAKTGLFGTKETFVPLDGATMEGSDIRVPYTKDFIKDAPNIDAEHHISEQEEDELYRYYNLRPGGSDDRGRDAALAGGAAGGVAGGAAGRDVDPDHGADGGADRGAGLDPDHGADGGADRGAGFDPDHGADGGADRGAGLDPDHGADGGADRGAGDSMVRREEELRVGTERRETGRVRLRKHVVTDTETATVPVEREEVHVEREPIRDGDAAGRIGDGRDEVEEVSMTVSEERPVVEKETVAKERVGLERDRVQDEETVTADVQREEIDVEQDGDIRREGDADGRRL